MNLVHFRTKGIPGRFPPGSFTTDSVREHIRDLFPTGLVGEYPTAPLDMSDNEIAEAAGRDAREPRVKDQRIPLRVVPGQHSAIISAALWQSNQQARRQRGHTPNSMNQARRQYMLTGVARCWECWDERGEDRPLYGTTGSGNSTRMYLCSWMKSRYNTKSRGLDDLPEQGLPVAQPVINPTSRHPATRRADPLEAATNHLINGLRVPAEWQDAILAYVLYDDGLIEFERHTYNLRQELERNQRLYQLAQITEADFIHRAHTINTRLQAIRPSARPEARQALPHLQSFRVMWEQLTAGEQRGLLQVVFAGLYFDAENRLRRAVTHAPFTRLLGLDTVTEFN